MLLMLLQSAFAELHHVVGTQALNGVLVGVVHQTFGVYLVVRHPQDVADLVIENGRYHLHRVESVHHE